MKLKRLISVSLAAALLACALTVPASANTVDRDYAFYDIAASSWVNTGTAKKDTASEVYAAPTDSPNGTTLAKTYCYVGGVARDKTTWGTAYLVSGNKYAINNYVYEDGDKVQRPSFHVAQNDSGGRPRKAAGRLEPGLYGGKRRDPRLTRH